MRINPHTSASAAYACTSLIKKPLSESAAWKKRQEKKKRDTRRGLAALLESNMEETAGSPDVQEREVEAELEVKLQLYA